VVRLEFTNFFEKKFKKIKDKTFKLQVIKQIEKLKTNPELGKPMKNVRKGTRELYVQPYRLAYTWNKDTVLILMLDIYHRDSQ